ncbi:hypothetical protein [Sphingosinicella microcystinivorans]|uniref:hypothetical protein n=1 Tax=Sphingosinicella microcystinivorans TaxID=335406 RepID=UPI0022F3FDAE|nr:hypothetical protein [Sphingosinicella microcystinivorans]WBX84778.1 hypothetical protein PE061_02330 [Sphingosinicella microcystinivorans]
MNLPADQYFIEKGNIKSNFINSFSILVKRKPISLLFLSFLFSIAFQLPGWPEIFSYVNGHQMTDRSVYERMVTGFDLPTDYISEYSLIMYFSAEFLWNMFLSYLNRSIGLSVDQIFFLITTMVIWRISFEIASRAGWIYTLLLMNPLIIDYAFSQLRIAFAIFIISFFWTGQRGKVITFFAYAVCASIHTSIFLFAIMHFSVNKFFDSRFKNLIMLCLTGFLIAILVGPLREAVLGAIGDRRAEYHDMSSTFYYLFFWILMWFFCLFRWKDIMASADGRYALIILSIVIVNAFTGGYSTRFIAAAFPSLVISMNKWPSKPVSLITLLFIPYASLQWLFWLRVI